MIRRRLSQLSEDLSDEAVAHLVSLAEQLLTMPDHCRAHTCSHTNLSLVVPQDRQTGVADLPHKGRPVKMTLVTPRTWISDELRVVNVLLTLQRG